MENSASTITKIINRNAYLVETNWLDLKEQMLNGGGDAADLIVSGSRIPITLKNGKEIEVEFGRDETGKGIFVFYDVYFYGVMNKEWTNKGAWKESDARVMAADIFAMLPDDLQQAIAPTHILQIQSGKRLETDDKLFMLSATQVFGKDYWSEREPDDTQIDIFKSPRGRIKVDPDNDEYAAWWWLRSAVNISVFCYVGSSGNYHYDFPHYSGGVVLGYSLI